MSVSEDADIFLHSVLKFIDWQSVKRYNKCSKAIISEETIMNNRQLAALETKQKLMKAAQKLICEKGLNDTSVEQITETAGVSKGTFYTYFKKKEDIVLALSRNMFGEILEQAKSLKGTFLEKLEFYMVNFSGYIEQGSVQMAQEWVKNVVNPNLVTDSFDKNKLYSDLNDMQALFSHAVEDGLLKKDFPVEDFAKMLVDVLYGEMLCWCMSDGAYSFRDRTQEYCKKYLVILIQPYLT